MSALIFIDQSTVAPWSGGQDVAAVPSFPFQPERRASTWCRVSCSTSRRRISPEVRRLLYIRVSSCSTAHQHAQTTPSLPDLMEYQRHKEEPVTTHRSDHAMTRQGEEHRIEITELDLCGGIRDKAKLEKLKEHCMIGFQVDENKILQWGIDAGYRWLPRPEDLEDAGEDIKEIDRMRRRQLTICTENAMDRIVGAWRRKLAIAWMPTTIKNAEYDTIPASCWSFPIVGRYSLHIAQSGKDQKLHEQLLEFKARLGIDEEPRYFTYGADTPKWFLKKPAKQHMLDKTLDPERFLEPLTEIPRDVYSFPGIRSRIYPEGTFNPLPLEERQTVQDEHASGA